MKPGLLSVTFRQLPPQEIIVLANKAGLEGIEWGGDIHVPHDRPDIASAIGRRTLEAGLEISAYGSYYRLGDPASGPIEGVLETALALQTGIVRVWAGRKGYDDSDQAEREAVADDGRTIARLARQAGLRIACEWHSQTLTDSAESAAELFDTVNDPDFLTFWQPRNFQDEVTNLHDMATALPRLAGLHVFNWDIRTRARLPLSEGETAWKAYLNKAKVRGSIFASLEFVAGDDPMQMVEDAATLRRWLSEI
ncbi:MAG: TIM barrel protein [Opitutaceae bacterium]